MSQAIHIEDKRKKNRRIAILIALVFHIGILVIAWFWMAWMRPIPPEVLIPEGVVVGFGGGEEGGGDNSLTSNAAPPADPNAPVTPDQPQEEVPTTPPTPNSAPVVSGGDDANTTPAQTPAPKPAIRNTYTPRNPNNGQAATGNEQNGKGPGEGGGQGNDKGPGTGGNGGTGGGIEGSVSGWKWKQTPNPQPCAANYKNTGYVTFHLVLSADGRIESCERGKSTLPSTVVDCIENAVRTQSRFEEIGDNNNTLNSKGDITIRLNYAP